MASSEDIALAGERQAAARRLLADPIVTAHSHPEDFAVVHAHSDWLIQQFDRVLGYELTVAADYARLAKAGLVRHVSQPLRRASGTPFPPRSYSYLALCLVALVDTAATRTLSQLAEEVRDAAAEAHLDLDPSDRASERRAFLAAVRHLTELGAVSKHGDDADAGGAGGFGEVTLQVHAEVVRSVVAHPPHAASDAREFLAAAEAATPQSDTAGEVALRRMLAETAVVYREDLSGRQRERLAHHQWRAAAELGSLLGCDVEIRAEGVALVMPEEVDDEQVTVFPGSEPAGQAALLLMERLVATMSTDDVPAVAVPVPAEVLETQITTLLDPGSPLQHRWARTALSHVPDFDDLVDRILELLRDAGLMRRSGDAGGRFDGWSVLAAAARYGGRPHGSARTQVEGGEAV